ncbi:MAG: OadG family protein [Holophagaceae bacterium]|nr:OadG family protein [Holophagaceae bacterium]
MTQLEAWIVAALGMSVVFLGLVLCIAFINVFNRVAKHVKWEEHGHHDAPPPVQKAEASASSEPVMAIAKVHVDPPTPEILAVIATAIEIDLRLYQSHGDQRLTIRR